MTAMMDDITFPQLTRQIEELFGAENYADALEMADEYAPIFPDQFPQINFWRMVLAARLGDLDLANRTLQYTLEAGTWYGELMLRDSPSLEPLQGNPEFERLAEISFKMRAADPTDQLPVLVVRPEGRCGDVSDPCPLIFFLHSNTDNPRANLPHWQGAASDGWLLALPQSSRAMWAGAYAWGGHEAAAKELEDRYAQLTEQYPVDSERVVLSGFSMGAEIALYLALSGRINAAGFILLGPGGPFMDDLSKWQPLIEKAAGSGLSGTIIMGLADETIPRAKVRELAAVLNDHDIPTELEEHPDLAHEYPPDFEVSLSNALAFIFG